MSKITTSTISVATSYLLVATDMLLVGNRNVKIPISEAECPAPSVESSTFKMFGRLRNQISDLIEMVIEDINIVRFCCFIKLRYDRPIVKGGSQILP